MNNYTQGKMVVRVNGDANSYALRDESGNWWMSVLMNGEQHTGLQEENLRRLAACWNACEGIDTDNMINFPGWVKAGFAPGVAIMTDRDRMLGVVCERDTEIAKVRSELEAANIANIARVVQADEIERLNVETTAQASLITQQDEGLAEMEVEIARMTFELARVQLHAELYNFVRTLKPAEFTDLFVANMRGAGRFDELVYAAMISRAQAAAQTVDKTPQTRMDAQSKPLVVVGAKQLLTNNQIKAIALKVGMVMSHDGKFMRSIGTHGGMNADDGIAFARAAIAASQASVKLVARRVEQEPVQPVAIGAPDPEAVFAEFCEVNGYPSDGDMDESLRKAFYAGLAYFLKGPVATHPQPVAPVHPDCGACPGDGSICKSECRVVLGSPPVQPASAREAFEAQMRAMKADDFTLRKWVPVSDAGASYKNQIVQDHWIVWQASAVLASKPASADDARDAVELPPLPDYTELMVWRDRIDGESCTLAAYTDKQMHDYARATILKMKAEK